MFKASSEYAADVSALADCLRAVSIGEIVEYRTLDRAIGRPCRAQRYLLQRALGMVEKEDGAVFEVVYRTGFKRLTASEYATVGHRARSAIRRKAGRASTRMVNGLAKANDVPPDAQRAVNREVSVLGLLQVAARDSTLRKRMENEPMDAPTPLAHAARLLMEALGGKSAE